MRVPNAAIESLAFLNALKYADPETRVKMRADGAKNYRKMKLLNKDTFSVTLLAFPIVERACLGMPKGQ